MEKRSKWGLASITLILFVVLIAALKVYDVEPIGPEGTKVGFSTINAAVHEFFGVSMLWYEITEVLGYLALAIAALMAAAGLFQLIKRRSFAAVDKEIYALGGLYVLTGIVYVVFEKVIINYRPVILPDETAPEASFPSSHTVLACVIFGSAVVMLSIYMEKSVKRMIIQTILDILMFITVFGRLISGVHWFTDICGGILISLWLVSTFDSVIMMMSEE